MEPPAQNKYSRRFSASNNSYRKALAANLTRNTKAKHLETEASLAASRMVSA